MNHKTDTGTIMVVDDNPASLGLLSNILLESGHRVRAFSGGKLAVHAAKQDPPDLIILDINMPEMNGYEVCQQFKTDSKLKGVPIMFISAYADLQEKINAFESGGVDYITKPFQSKEVVARVRTQLKLVYARQELLHSRDRLEELVRERTVELEKANQVQQESNRLLRELYQHLDHVREEEKANIARRIHDELGVSLTVLTLDLGYLAQQGKEAGYSTLLKNKLEEMAKLLENAVHVSRNIMSDLHPSILDTLGLVEAIEWQAQEFGKRADTTCHVQAKKLTFGIKNNAAIAIFRVFQESMTNIIKHARATHVQVILDYDDQWLILRVEDDGIGLTEGWDSRVKSYGVRGMRERAYAFEGELHLENRKACGTSLILRVPVRSVAERLGSIVNQ